MVAITEEWVSFWYQCLSQNIDYSTYCNARTNGDSITRTKFEQRFEHIEQIYEDFGTLDGWPEAGIRSELWREWFAPRKHLFMASAQIISGNEIRSPAPGHVLIDVQLQKDAAATIELIANTVRAHYKEHTVAAPNMPKYVLHLKNGRLAHGYEKVRQACLSAARTYCYAPDTFEERRHVDAVTEFVRHELDNLGWSIDPLARRELEEFGTLSDQRLDSYKAMLNRCRRDFQAFAKNTIRGRFPDNSPFDSEVLDFF